MLIITSAWVTFLLLLTLELRKLKYQLSLLPDMKITFNNHKLYLTNINDFIKETNIEDKTTIMFLSPTCKVCHEELDNILKKKVHKKKNMHFLGEALDQQKFDRFTNEYSQIDIIPLYKEQLQKLDRGIYPLFMDVNEEGIITRIYRR